MRGLRAGVAAVVVVCVLAPSAAASDWVSNGPWGGAIQSLVLDPQRADVAYAIADEASYRTEDAGLHWSRLPGDGVTALAFDPRDARRMFRATRDGFFASDDGGASWSQLSSVGGGSQIVVAPSDDAVIYRRAADEMLASEDGGRTWRRMVQRPAYPTDLAVDPSDSSVVYACDGSFWRSRNGGLSFHRLDTGLPVIDGMRMGVRAIALDSSAPGTLYGASGDAVYRTVDGGEHWLRQGGVQAGATVTRLALDPSDPAHLVAMTTAGIQVSRDAGASWKSAAMGAPVQTASSLTVSPVDGARVYVGTQSAGVFVTRDGGASWRASSEGIHLLDVGAIAVDPTNPETIYAGASSFEGAGVFRSDDAGGSWRPIDDGLVEGDVVAIAAAATPGRVYLLMNSGAVYRSETGGASWQRTAAPLGIRAAHQLVIDPVRPDTVYAAADAGVLVSHDSGDSWTTTLAYPVTALTVEHVAPWRVYAPSPSFGIFRSDDHGDEWIRPANPWAPAAKTLAADPSRPGVLYAIENATSQLFVSHDGGAHWNDPRDPVTYESLEGPLVVDPRVAGTVYAGQVSGSSGVGGSFDGGATWASLGHVSPRNLVFEAPGALLRAGESFEGGVWRLVLPPVPWPAGRPRVRGDARVGATLRCDPGSWPDTAALSVSWRVGTGSVEEVTADDYTLTAADAGQSVRCAVAGTTRDGSITAVSAPVFVADTVGGPATGTSAPAPPSAVAQSPSAPAQGPTVAPALVVGTTAPGTSGPMPIPSAEVSVTSAATSASRPAVTPLILALAFRSTVRAVVLAAGRIPVTLACVGPGACSGSLSLRLRSSQGRPVGARLATLSARLQAHQQRRFLLLLSAKARRLFPPGRRRTLVVVLVQRDAGGKARAVQRALVVVAPRGTAGRAG